MQTFYQVGKDVWLSGTRLKDLGTYLKARNIYLTDEQALEIEIGHRECQLFELNDWGTNLLDSFLEIRKQNNG